MPFLRRSSPKRKFRTEERKKSPPKPRNITYAGRRDSVIFRYYRDMLSERYEDTLREQGLKDCVLAYRSIPSGEGHFKSNIDFAIEAFRSIKDFGDASVFCLDIKSFFDNIAHDDVFQTWKKLLGVHRLPPDHFAVMEAATKYSFIEEKAAFGILGYFGLKQSASGAMVRGYLKPRRSLPRRLCSRKDFTEKIAKNVTRNTKGIPQGLPISDVLANAVLLQFDVEMNLRCRAAGGLYRRYSDDLLVVIPGKSIDADKWILDIQAQLSLKCTTLCLGLDKTAAYAVRLLPNRTQQVIPIAGYRAIPTIDYLGLSYDGIAVYLRQSTLSRLKGRIVRRVRRQVEARFDEDPAVTAVDLYSRLHLEGIMREFGRIEMRHRVDKALPTRGPRGSFRCYAVRASKAAGFKTSKILEQISHLTDFVRARAQREIGKVIP
jgi:hypothetical protein